MNKEIVVHTLAKWVINISAVDALAKEPQLPQRRNCHESQSTSAMSASTTAFLIKMDCFISEMKLTCWETNRL